MAKYMHKRRVLLVEVESFEEKETISAGTIQAMRFSRSHTSPGGGGLSEV